MAIGETKAGIELYAIRGDRPHAASLRDQPVQTPGNVARLWYEYGGVRSHGKGLDAGCISGDRCPQ